MGSYEEAVGGGGDDDVVALAGKLFDMARAGETTSLMGYIDDGVPADLTNEKGDSLLMLAAYNGHAETVAELIARDADVNRLNDRGQAPVAGAVFKGHRDVIAALVEAGADLDKGTPSAREAAEMFGTPLPG